MENTQAFVARSSAQPRTATAQNTTYRLNGMAPVATSAADFAGTLVIP
jgi:hypothetical protein